MFNVGDKVIINFNKILYLNNNATREDISDDVVECAKLNKDKIFTIKRIPDNDNIVLTEEIKPFSNYIHIDYIISVREQRKDKLKKLNEKI